MEKIKKLVQEAINLIKAGGELTPKELATGRINRRREKIKELTRYLEAGREPITIEEANKLGKSLEEAQAQASRTLEKCKKYIEKLKRWNKEEKKKYNHPEN